MGESKNRNFHDAAVGMALLVVALERTLRNNAGKRSEAAACNTFVPDYAGKMILSYDDQTRSKLSLRSIGVHSHHRALQLPWQEGNFLPGGLPANPRSEHMIQGLYLHCIPDLTEKAVNKCASAVSSRKATYLTYSEIESCFIDKVTIKDNQCVVIPYPGAHLNGSFQMSFLFRDEAYNQLALFGGIEEQIPEQEFVVMSCQNRVFL